MVGFIKGTGVGVDQGNVGESVDHRSSELHRVEVIKVGHRVASDITQELQVPASVYISN